MIFSYPYSFDDRCRQWNEAKTDYVEGRISTSIGQAERSVPDDVKRKRKKAMAVAERERVAKRDREDAIQGERDHQEYMERSV